MTGKYCLGICCVLFAVACGAENTVGPAEAISADEVLQCESGPAPVGKMNQMLNADPKLADRVGISHVTSCADADFFGAAMDTVYAEDHPEEPGEATDLLPPETDKIINGSGSLGTYVVQVNGCSGVVIHPRVILTAAHCSGAKGTHATEVYVSNKYGTPVSAYSGNAHWSPNPNYLGGANATWDVAVVTLASAASGVTPVNLYLGNLTTSSYVFLGGWGWYDSTHAGREHSGYVDLDSVSANIIGATAAKYEPRLCYGDSGGLWGPWHENQVMVAGIQSTAQIHDGDKCAYVGGNQKAHRLKPTGNWVRSHFKFSCKPYPNQAGLVWASCMNDTPWY